MSVLSGLTAALSDGSIEVIDLTTPLSGDTPILSLPQPLANTVGLTLSPVSNFDDAGPAWAWNDVTVGEHAGTHLDAPVHWITGREGKSVDRIEPRRLVGPAVVIDKTAEVAQDPDFLLEPEHLEQWQEEHGQLPENCWVIFRTAGPPAEEMRRTSSMLTKAARILPVSLLQAPSGLPATTESAGSAWKPLASTPARRQPWTPCSRSTPSSSARTNTE